MCVRLGLSRAVYLCGDVKGSCVKDWARKWEWIREVLSRKMGFGERRCETGQLFKQETKKRGLQKRSNQYQVKPVTTFRMRTEYERGEKSCTPTPSARWYVHRKK